MRDIASIRLTDNLLQDPYTSPYVELDGDYLVFEIDISRSETQVFLYSLVDQSLFAENFLWIEEQKSLVRNALHCITTQTTQIVDTYNSTFLAGVWHFGHLIGDHLHQLIDLPKTRTLHCSSSQSLLHDLCKLVYSPVTCEYINGGDNQISPLRVYRPYASRCYFPAKIKSIPLSVCRARIMERLSYLPSFNTPVFLTSGRTARISNICPVAKFLRDIGFLIVNPYITPVRALLQSVASTDFLLTENGSILFNCFLARNNRYFVLASDRSLSLSPVAYTGGGIYNQFHKHYIQYIPCTVKTFRHHPFSDQLHVDCSKLLSYLRHEGFPY